jgi:hypothetical protein
LVGWTHQMCCNQWSNIREMSKVWRIDISYVPSRGANICQECTQHNNWPYFTFLFFLRDPVTNAEVCRNKETKGFCIKITCPQKVWQQLKTRELIQGENHSKCNI